MRQVGILGAAGLQALEDFENGFCFYCCTFVFILFIRIIIII